MPPWITTADELGGGVQPTLEMRLRINGEERQHDNTGEMMWKIDQVLNWVVRRTSLTTGNVFFTGTTAGVGLEDGRFFEPGDLVESEIEHPGDPAEHCGRASPSLGQSRPGDPA